MIDGRIIRKHLITAMILIAVLGWLMHWNFAK